MADSVANLLLRITGDSDDARRDLEETAAELAAFGRQTAEAEAEVDTTAAKTALDLLQARLKEIDGTSVDAQANLDIAKAMIDAETLSRELAALDRDDVDIDVDVKRSVIQRITTLSRSVGELGDQTDETRGRLGRLTGAFGDGDNSINRLTGRLRLLLRLFPALVSGAGAVAGSLGGLIASLGRAILGAGSLATAFGATLLPVIALGIGAISRFKDTVDKAGSAAHELARVAGRAGEAFADMTKHGADRIFEGMAAALRDLTPMLSRLAPDFTRLGGAIGQAFRTLGKEFSNPAWERFFSFITRSAADLTPLITQAFIPLARILRNIATASMPFLLEAFRDLGRFLRGVAEDTGNISKLRDAIRPLIESTRAWVDLLGGIGSLFAGIMKAAGPFGDELVRYLADGARELGNWLRSGPGMQRVAEYFADILPLAKELVDFVAKLVRVFLQLGQLLAPIFTPFLRGVNEVLDALSSLLEVLNGIPAPIRGVIGTIAGLVLGFGKIKAAGKIAVGAFNLVVGALRILGGAFGDVLGRIRTVVGNIVSAVRKAFNAAKDAVVNAAKAIFERVRTIFGNVLEAARRIWQNIRDAVRNAFTATRDAVVNILSSIFDRVRTVFGNILETARRIWQNVRETIATIFGNAREAVGNILSAMFTAVSNVLGNIFERFRTVLSNVLEFIRGLAEKFLAAGKALGEKVVDGVVHALHTAGRAVKDAAQAIWDAVEGIITKPIDMVIHLKLPSLPDTAALGPAGGGEPVKKLAAGAFSTLSALAGTATAPIAFAATGPVRGGQAAGGNNYNLNVTTVGGGPPDPGAMLAKLSVLLQARGGV